MLRQLSLAVALVCGALFGGPAIAQQDPVPDRRIVTTTGQDFYGSDIGSIFETTFKACREACIGNLSCRALTYNTRAEACFLKSGIDRREPFDGAISAEMIETSAEVRNTATVRVQDLDFIDAEMLEGARALAANLGSRVAANGLEASAARAAGTTAELSGNLGLAAQNYAAAATIADQADAWRDLARVWLALKGATSSETRRNRRDALIAAINAYLRSGDDPGRASSLLVLADALEARGHGRKMIPALELAQSLSPRREIGEKLAYAQSNYGFRVVGHDVDSDAAQARICVEFSDALAQAGVDYAPYVKFGNGADLPIETQGQQLCVDGVERGTRYSLTIRQGLPSNTGELLSRSSKIEAYIRDRSPSVRFAGRAHVLPRSADAAIPVVTVNLNEVEIAIHRIGERNLLPAIQDDLFDSAINKWREDRIDAELGEAVWTGRAEVSGPVNADVTTALPLGDAIEGFRPGVYVMTARVPGDRDEWDRAATQWFVVTDLGVASMSGADGLHGFVRSLATAEPVAGASVRLVARNNDVLGEAETDAQGYVRFSPGLLRGQGGAAPAMLSVEREGDFAFLDLSKPGFDLSDRGVEGRPAPGPVDVFATTERGVYRPGEVVHVTALARDGRADAIADLPLTAIVTRPDGVEYQRALLADEGAGGRSHSMRLGAGVPRGTWNLKLHTDPKAPPVTQLSFLVEDFVPEKIDFDLEAPEGMVARDAPVEVSLNARYLYGAPGADLPVETQVRLTEADEIPGFKGFQFGLHDETVGAISDYMADVTTDANGDARVEITVPETDALTKPLKLTAIVHVTESSGRPVERTLTRAVAPGGVQIGIRPLFEGAAEEGGNARFEVVAVGSDGKQIALDRVGWTLSKVHYHWQWYRLNGRWNWESITRRERLSNGTVQLDAQNRAVIEAPVDWGTFELKLANLGDERAVASHKFHAGWYTGGASTDTPGVLEVGLDRETYQIGDTVQLRLKPRDAGKVLISVVDNRLIEMKSVEVEAGETSVDLTVTEEWGPGAYITATLIRPMDEAAGRNPSRSLGLAWATVDPADRKLDVSFTTPDEVAPRGPLPASVRVANLAPGTEAFVTIAAVDLGILNLTGFEPPAPDEHYFGQRALGMEMRDLYGKLIEGMQGARGRLRSGGDAAAARLKAPPPTEELVAYFSGVLKVGPDGTALARFEVPDFNGTVRLMAVAWTADGVGHAAKDVLVRDPIVVSAAVPRFLAPRDETRVLIELAHATGPSGEVSVSVETDGGLSVVQNAANRVRSLEEDRIERISLPVTAVEIGDPKLRIRTVTPGGQVLTKALTLPVRLNDPEINRQSKLRLAAGGGRLVIDRSTFDGFEIGTARATLAVGAVAQFDAPGLMEALDRYPYGCTEQTTSRALPLLYFDDMAEALGMNARRKVKERVDGAIARVLENQSSSGSFGLWRPDRGDLWLDAYVTDFLSRARVQGYEVPQTAFRAAIDNLLSSLSYAGDFEQGGEDVAHALMVLAREGQASIGDLRYYADAKAENLATPMAKAQLGAALALYGEQLRADEMFRLAEQQVIADTDENFGWRHDYGSHLRDGAAVLALAAEARSSAINRERIVNAITSKQRRWTSTQEKVWMLMASHAQIGTAADNLLVDGASAGAQLIQRFEASSLGNRQTEIQNIGASAAPAILTVYGVPIDPQPAGGRGYRIERAYYTLDGDPVLPETVAQNDRLAVVLTVHSDEDRTGRLMIDDPLPAGFEIDNPSLLQAGSVKGLSWLKTVSETDTSEFRSDRFLSAVTRSGRGAFRLAYIVRAVSPGRFHHPAALVEDMYRPEYRAWTATGTVQVVPAP